MRLMKYIVPLLCKLEKNADLDIQYDMISVNGAGVIAWDPEIQNWRLYLD